MMKKQFSQVLSLLLAFTFVLTLNSCGKDQNSNQGTTEGEKLVWYLGGNNHFSGDVDVKTLFDNVEDSVEPSKLYESLTLTEDMIHGVYTLNNKEKDLKTVRNEIPFEEVQFKSGAANVTILPIAVYFGADHICSSATSYKYSAFEEITDHEVAVLELATEDTIGQTPCIYELNGNNITFKQITQTSSDDEPLTYEYTGIEFTYQFSLSGPYMTFSRDGYSLQLKAYCLTENTDDALYLSAYSLPDSPLVASLDCFVSSDNYNFAIKRDGSYCKLSAFKMDDEGRFTVYLTEKAENGDADDTFIKQYAYIMQSNASSFFSNFSIILFDGSKIYYYTDDVTKRETRVLEDQGVDVNELSEEEIKEIAKKKSDLFDDLQTEFEAQGINVTINRSTGEIAMDASVLFGGDSAVITDDGKALLNKFLAAYTSIIYNDKYEGFISMTRIEGHTAPVAGDTYEDGLPLSQERAANVKDYCLSSDTGVDASRLAASLEAVGLSNSKPVYDTDGEVDMEACRRVSFRFIVNLENQTTEPDVSEKQ